MNDQAHTIPQSDLDAEGVILSACMLEREAFDQVEPILRGEHFYADANRRIFDAIADLISTGKPHDPATVAGWLRDRNRLDQVGGTPYIALLVEATPVTVYLAATARRVVDKWRLRQAISECRQIIAEAYTHTGDVGDFVQKAEARIYAVSQDMSRATTLKSSREVMRECFQETKQAREEKRPAGASTGFESLDRRIGGLKPGRVYVGAGRPGGGKTSFLTQAAKATAVARTGNRGVFLASIEMPAKQIGDRFIAQEAQLDTRLVESGAMSMTQWGQYAAMASDIAKWPIIVEEFPGISISQLRSSLRRAVRRLDREYGQNLGLIGVDYLQLMGSTGRLENENAKLTEISAGIACIAKEFNVPVILLSQLNRDVEKNPGKRPMMSNLRGSGSIEQDAHTIIFFHRDDMYRGPGEAKDGKAEFIVAKCRGGRTGTVSLMYQDYCTKFIDCIDDDPEDAAALQFASFGDAPTVDPEEDWRNK